jgi:acyl-CoA reductase-like NAD-dependent aldehyde dehydrogenase
MTTYNPAQASDGKLLINGEWVSARTGKTFAAVNPSNEKPLAQFQEGGAEDVDAAVHAARRAFESGPWSRMAPRERGSLLFKLADLVEQHKERLAILESMDNGKPIRETLAFDLPQVIETFRYYGGWADKIYGDVNAVSPNFFSYTLKEPAGVVGQIIPWNFPLLMAAWKLGPALATGCTVVLKPAEQTPVTAIELGKLICEAGFPAGVVNIVTGAGDTGAALSRHKGVDKIAFTGSTEVGRLVMKAAAENLKRVSMELGGKAPNIVFDDADLDKAVSGALLGIYFNQGEVCCAGSRLYLHAKIYDQFVEKFQKAAEKVVVGNPLNDQTTMGAQVSQEQHERILSFIEAGKNAGATLATGGKSLRPELGGYFVRPTLFTDVSRDAKIFREEIFGPVLCATRFEDTDKMIECANDTDYGLSAGVWTQNLSRAHTVTRRLRAGTVWINCYNQFDAGVPFGGYKASGFGRELGKQALELYTGDKAVWVAM